MTVSQADVPVRGSPAATSRRLGPGVTDGRVVRAVRRGRDVGGEKSTDRAGVGIADAFADRPRRPDDSGEFTGVAVGVVEIRTRTRRPPSKSTNAPHTSVFTL